MEEKKKNQNQTWTRQNTDKGSKAQYTRKESWRNKPSKPNKQEHDPGAQNKNRFGGFISHSNEEEEVATSDNTSSISDFSFGDEKWSIKKISDVFKRLNQEQNPKRITRIVEKGLHQIVYESPDKPELVIKFATLALERVNVEKGILDSLKRLRILEEVNAK